MPLRAALLSTLLLLAGCSGLLESGETRVRIPAAAPDACIEQALDALLGAGSTRAGRAGWVLAAFPWEGHSRVETAGEARTVHLELSRVRRYTADGPPVAARLQQAADLLTTTCHAVPAPPDVP